MKSILSIDAAGRIVLPQPVRKHFHLDRGSKLEMQVGPEGILLRPQHYPTSLAEEHGLLVHEGEPTGDLLLAVEAVRERRDRQVNGGLE